MPYMPNATLRVTMALSLLLAIVTIASFTVPPLYRQSKSRRAVKAIGEMHTELESGNWSRAGNRVKLALSLAPMEPEVLRGVGLFCSRLGNPTGLQYWQMLLDSGKATRQDRIEYVRALLQADQPEPARRLLVELLREQLRDFDCLELSLRALLLENRTKDALVAARSLAEYFPENDKGLFSLAQTLLAQKETALKKEGQAILWGLALRDNPLVLPAIRLLSTQTNLSQADFLLLSRRLPNTNSLPRLLLGLELEERLGRNVSPTNAARRALEGLPPESTIETRLSLVDWLFARKLYAEGMQIIPPTSIQTNTAALQRHLEGLGSLRRWDEASRFVEDPSYPLSPVLRDVYRAVVASRLGTREEVIAHLASAAAGTAEDPSLARLVAGYAEAFDQPRIAADALQSLLANPNHVQRTGPKVLRLLAKVDDTQPIIQALDRLLQFNPEDPDLLNDRAWWLTVTGQRIDEARSTATQLLRQRPGNLRILATLALSHVRDNNPDQALQVIENPYLNEPRPPLRARIAYCAALGLAGQREAARKIGSSINPGSIRSAERLLVQEWTAQPPQ